MLQISNQVVHDCKQVHEHQPVYVNIVCASALELLPPSPAHTVQSSLSLTALVTDSLIQPGRVTLHVHGFSSVWSFVKPFRMQEESR